MMKAFLLIIAIACATTLTAQQQPVKSQVYVYKDLPVTTEDARERRQVAEGSAHVLEYLEMHTTTVEPGKAPHAPHKHADEELIIVKEGQLKVTIENETKVLGPGSIAVALPGDMHGMVNVGDTKATYYVLKYRSKTPADPERGKKAGGSFMIDWNDVTFRAHGNGGVREYIKRPTTMLKRFDMHVTTLKEGLKSHEPHTHAAEEIVLMIKGNSEMQIGDNFYKGTTGDLYFLGSMIPHAIRNDDTAPIMYYAFQWD